MHGLKGFYSLFGECCTSFFWRKEEAYFVISVKAFPVFLLKNPAKSL